VKLVVAFRNFAKASKNVSDRSCRENQNINFMFSNISLQASILPESPQMKTPHMRIAYWTLKAKNTHSEYVIFTAFPPQQWLQESASA